MEPTTLQVTAAFKAGITQACHTIYRPKREERMRDETERKSTSKASCGKLC